MDIGIIGSGHIGSTLARQLTALGHQVSVANSRGPRLYPGKSVRHLPRDIFATSAAVIVDAWKLLSIKRQSVVEHWNNLNHERRRTRRIAP